MNVTQSKIEGCELSYVHHSDFSGDVEIISSKGDTLVKIPFRDIKSLVAEYLRVKRISRLEQMSDEDFLEMINQG